MSLFKRAVSTAMVAGAIAGFAVTAQAKTELTISSWAPPTHGINAVMWPKFVEMIEQATQGRVTAQIKYNIGSPPAQLDMVQDGAADFSWIFNGYTPGRFAATKLIELPGFKGSAEAASVAYWRVHNKYLAKANEHRGVTVVSLMTHGPGVLHSASYVNSLDQIKGMKLRLGGGVAGDAGTLLGATGIRVPAPKVYETLASNAADGVMMPWEGKKSFKLTEVAPHTYEMPGGFYRGAFAIIMNTDRLKSLSKKDQAALTSPAFGEAVAKMAGAVWDQIDAEGRLASAQTKGNTATMATDADVAKYAEMTKPIIDQVVADATKAGVDGKAALEAIKAELAAYK
ncbi:MAG: TRAP transporter substrate-binding protein [Burkholderiaceae bacterium]